MPESLPSQPPTRDPDWTTATPEAAGFAQEFAGRLASAIESGAYPGLHGLVVARHGCLVLERYLTGVDQRWGEPLGRVAFAPEIKHDLRSVSKSMVSLLYGIALAEGLVPPLSAPLAAQFTDRADFKLDPAISRITLHHIITMTMGTEWNEDVPYDDPANSEVAMENAADRYRYILEKPVVAPPGHSWSYSGGATAILGHLIEKGAGRSLHAYAQEKLFQPLGIRDTEWVAGRDGVIAAASGLRMRPRDLARIGQLILQQGAWLGRQIIPRAWLAESFVPRIACFDGIGYGYQWYIDDVSNPGRRWLSGMGNGGQRLIMNEDLGIVVAITAGNYNRADQIDASIAIMRDHIVPGATARG